MKRIYIICLLFLAMENFIYAQDYNLSSPQTWDFQALGRIPISQYTGNLNYSVPIYEYKDRDFDIPISVSYNSAGFVPNKPASTVGLNWCLNVGGCITRKIRGQADEYKSQIYGLNGPTGFWVGSTLYNIECNDEKIFNFLITGGAKWVSFDDLAISPSGSSVGCYYYLISDSSNFCSNYDCNFYEIAPDEFTFNFMGHSGKFMLDLNGNPTVYNCDDAQTYQVDMTNFKEKTSGSYLNGYSSMASSEIVITTGDGYKYYFGGSYSAMELTLSSNTTASTPTVSTDDYYPTSWYLTLIEAPNGRAVEFTYMDDDAEDDPFDEIQIDGTVKNSSGLSDANPVKYWITYVTPGFIETSHDYLLPGNFPCYNSVSGNSYQFVRTVYLESILIDGEEEICNINYSLKSQKDIPDNNFTYKNLKIDSIVFKNTENEIIRNAVFDYTYGSDRMFLEGISINGEENYGFEYTNIGKLPDADTKELDHWGFWTGKRYSNQDSLIPEFTSNNYYANECVIRSKNVDGVTVTGCREPHKRINYAGMLSSIEYPTGGKTEIEYEPHTYYSMLHKNKSTSEANYWNYSQMKSYYNRLLPDDTDSITYTPFENLTLRAGGFRVKSIKDYDGTGYVNNREFIYKTDFDGDDSGILLNYPNYRKAFSDDVVTYKEVSSHGTCIDNFSNHICYSSVIEKTDTGYIKCEFSTINEYPDYDYVLYTNSMANNAYPIAYGVSIDMNSHETEEGKLIKQTFFNTNKDTVKSITYDYKSLDTDDYITSVTVNMRGFNSHKTYISACPLIKKIIRDFSADGSFIAEKSTSYTYNDYGQNSEIKTTSSTGDTIKTSIIYSSDIDSCVYKNMVSINMLNFPIVQTENKNGNITSSTLTTYKSQANSYNYIYYVPDSVLSLETTSPLSSITTFMGTSSSIDSHYGDTETKYIDYDDFGNPSKIKSKTGIYTYYLWAYDSQYPVVKIESSTNTTISITVDDDELSKSDNLSNVQDDVSYLDSLLSSYINNTYYMVTLCTYKPLVGMTSETVPNGTTTYYEYDDFGRLSAIKNDDGDLLNEYEYHYANE